MASITYHSDARGTPGILTYITGTDGVSRGGVIPAMLLTDDTGAAIGTSTNPIPTSAVSKGGSNIATNQVAVTTSATLVVAARAGRHKVIISSTTAVVFYVGATGVTTTTGLYVAAAAGASITLDTAAAVYAIGASAVTLSYVELY